MLMNETKFANLDKGLYLKEWIITILGKQDDFAPIFSCSHCNAA